MDINNLAKKMFEESISFGSGFTDAFPKKNGFNFIILEKIIKEFCEPFTLETYKKYDSDFFDKVFKKYNFSDREKEIFFTKYRQELEKQIVIEYYDYFKND